jgi:hypothetical protein
VGSPDGVAVPVADMLAPEMPVPGFLVRDERAVECSFGESSDVVAGGSFLVGSGSPPDGDECDDVGVDGSSASVGSFDGFGGTTGSEDGELEVCSPWPGGGVSADRGSGCDVVGSGSGSEEPGVPGVPGVPEVDGSGSSVPGRSLGSPGRS